MSNSEQSNSKRKTLLQSAIDETISIHDYNPEWPAMFARERTRLLVIFSSDLIEIEHIGSTAVPNLPSKPIIDMIAGVRSIERATALLVPLREYGYVTPPNCNDALIDRQWLMRHSQGHRTHHLHLVIMNSTGWRSAIRFRDILRADPAIAKEYATLKYRSAEEAGTDRTQYIQSKAAFIERVIAAR